VLGAGAVASAVAVRHSHLGADAKTSIAVTAGPWHGVDSTPAVVDPTAIATTFGASQSTMGSATPVAATPRIVARSVPRSAESGASVASALPVELATLDRARGAMGAGELTRALAILDAYAARFPRGAMAPEAAVLRVEALVKAGDRPGAKRFANAFLASAPRSPYAMRIQSLLAESNP
jgi:TolA-binding protein